MPEEPKPNLEVIENPDAPDPTEAVIELPVTEQPSPSSPPATPAAPAQKPGESEQAYNRRIQALENQFNGSRRILEGIQKTVGELANKVNAPAPVTPVTNGNFWEDLDPRVKTEVEKLVIQTTQNQLTQREAIQKADQQVVEAQQTLNQSIEKLFTRYPDLRNDESPATQLYLEVQNQHPEWLQNPHGPILAMSEMETLAAERGVKLTPAKPSAPAPAAPSRGRGLSSLPPSRQVPTNTVTITREDMDFCKNNGLDPVEYMKNRKVLESGGGIEA